MSELPTLILTVGLPRSGKSTWARQQGHPVVCPDQIRLAVHGQCFLPSAEPLVWWLTRTMVRALFGSGHSVVILDATNVSRQRRDEWQSAEWHTRFRVFATTRQVCLERAQQQGDEVLPQVIIRMARQWEPLTAEEQAAEYCDPLALAPLDPVEQGRLLDGTWHDQDKEENRHA
jgi:predicted kinase